MPQPDKITLSVRPAGGYVPVRSARSARTVSERHGRTDKRMASWHKNHAWARKHRNEAGKAP